MPRLGPGWCFFLLGLLLRPSWSCCCGNAGLEQNSNPLDIVYHPPSVPWQPMTEVCKCELCNMIQKDMWGKLPEPGSSRDPGTPGPEPSGAHIQMHCEQDHSPNQWLRAKGPDKCWPTAQNTVPVISDGSFAYVWFCMTKLPHPSPVKIVVVD